MTAMKRLRHTPPSLQTADNFTDHKPENKSKHILENLV